jgi:hypothetical protein
MYRSHHWRAEIQDAPDVQRLLCVIQEFRDVLPAQALELLPPECRDSLDRDDIPHVARTFLQAAMTAEACPEAMALLHEIARTYATAAVRIARWQGDIRE